MKKLDRKDFVNVTEKTVYSKFLEKLYCYPDTQKIRQKINKSYSKYGLTISDEILFALKGGSDNWLLVSESYLYALNKDENGIAPKKLITYPIIAWDDIKCLKINKVKKGYHDNIEVWVNDQKYYETGIVCSFIDEMNSLFSVVLSSLDSIAECDIEAVSRINTNYTDFEHELARTDKFVVLFLTNKPEIKFQEDYVLSSLNCSVYYKRFFSVYKIATQDVKEVKLHPEVVKFPTSMWIFYQGKLVLMPFLSSASSVNYPAYAYALIGKMLSKSLNDNYELSVSSQYTKSKSGAWIATKSANALYKILASVGSIIGLIILITLLKGC